MNLHGTDLFGDPVEKKHTSKLGDEFLIPPFSVLSAREGGWLGPDALIVVEEAGDAGFSPPERFAELERRRYDDTEFVFMRNS